MSKKSNNQGRAFEYICLTTLFEEIKRLRKVKIIENTAFFANKRAFENVDVNLQENFKNSAKAMIQTLFSLEPLICEESENYLFLIFQTDEKGEEGDVRDIIILRDDIKWEIGLSIKHNHFAVKHSRLSKDLDFGKRWFNIPCSNKYWDDIKPIFDYLQSQKDGNKTWNDLENKEDDVYVPLLKAFIDEINSSNKQEDIAKKMVEYLLGEYDFYKVISIDNKKITQIQAYNLRGNLNKTSKNAKSKIVVPISSLPTRIVKLEFKPNSKNTVELYLDNGWQFSFRIHNASTKVETSLKFDIKIVGMPCTVLVIDCNWIIT